VAYWAQQQIRGRFRTRLANTLGITPASSFYNLLVTDHMDSTLRETINELNKMNDIYKYNDNDAGIKGDLYISSEVYLDASVLDDILDKISLSVTLSLFIFTPYDLKSFIIFLSLIFDRSNFP
jgi:hypothetical protein